MAAGLTVALAAGMPLGTWLGGAFGWRSTMVFVAALAALATLGMLRLPASEPPPRTPLRIRLAPLRRPAILTALLSVLIAASGGLMAYEYIAPIAAEATGAGPRALAALIAAAGVAGAIGTWLGSRATDRFGPERTTLVAVGGQVASVLAMAALGYAMDQVPVVLFGFLFAGWALGGWAFNPAMHLRLINLAGDAGGEVVGLNNSALFFGISIAGGLGGAVLSGFGAPAVPLASGLLSLIALAVFAVSFRTFRTGAAPSERVTVGAGQS